MSIELLVEKMIANNAKKGLPVFPKCDESEIERQSKYFGRTLEIEMPEAYKSVLRLTNGMVYNGLKIWPVTSHNYMKEDVYAANENLSPDREFIVLAQYRDELYVYDHAVNQYVASELHGSNLKEFKSADEMLEFVINKTVSE